MNKPKIIHVDGTKLGNELISTAGEAMQLFNLAKTHGYTKEKLLPHIREYVEGKGLPEGVPMEIAEELVFILIGEMCQALDSDSARMWVELEAKFLPHHTLNQLHEFNVFMQPLSFELAILMTDKELSKAERDAECYRLLHDKKIPQNISLDIAVELLGEVARLLKAHYDKEQINIRTAFEEKKKTFTPPDGLDEEALSIQLNKVFTEKEGDLRGAECTSMMIKMDFNEATCIPALKEWLESYGLKDNSLDCARLLFKWLWHTCPIEMRPDMKEKIAEFVKQAEHLFDIETLKRITPWLMTGTSHCVDLARMFGCDRDILYPAILAFIESRGGIPEGVVAEKAAEYHFLCTTITKPDDWDENHKVGNN